MHPPKRAGRGPLTQVVARSFEFGVRGRTAGTLRLNAGFFQTANSDDILFVGTTTSAGYFTNFGRTRRRGLELGVSGAGGPLEWRAAYSFIRAEFRSSTCVVSENNSSRGTSPECSPEDQSNPGTFLGDDLITVQPGNRIPGIPEQSLKLALAYRPSSAALLGAELMAFSKQYVRGNENNEHQPGTFQDLNSDSRTFLGSGKTTGYAVVNLHGRYGLGSGWELFGRVNNLFDRRYVTAGQLAENPFNSTGQFRTDSDTWTRETFYAPGTPRAAWIGVRHRFSR
jgi:iron complex outermembrane recepter protein